MACRGPSEIELPSGRFDRLAAAADPHRLAILATLREAGELPIEELCTRVVTREGGAGTGSDLAPATVYHVHLPKLTDADLVEVGGGACETVVRPGPAFEAEIVEALERGVESGSIDDGIVSALDEPRRQRAVSVLSAARGAVELEELATAVAARSPGPERADGPTTDPAIMLHHVDLPKLDAAGVVDYDAGDARVTYLGLPDELSAVVADG